MTSTGIRNVTSANLSLPAQYVALQFTKYVRLPKFARMPMEFGELTNAELQSAWPNEAYDFHSMFIGKPQSPDRIDSHTTRIEQG